MVSFSLALYTMEGAHALAKEWARRMQFYFDLWFEANLTDFDYSQDMIDMCGDSVEFLDVVLAEEDGSPLWKRALEIRECRPKRVDDMPGPGSARWCQGQGVLAGARGLGVSL
jgi:hypothetical protein